MSEDVDYMLYGTPNFIVGVITATSFVGDLTGTASTAIESTNAYGLLGVPNLSVGIVTASSFIGNLTGSASTSNVSTNAYGLLGAPNLNVGIVTASSFIGNLTGTASTASASATAYSLTGTPNLNVGSVTASSFSGSGSGITGISTLNIVDYGVGLGGSDGSISGIDTTGTSFFNHLNLSGVITATSFYGSGANITGISTLNIVDYGVGLGGGVVGGGESYWEKTSAGINTISNVGIATTNPQTPLQIENVYGLKTGSGEFTASAGVAHTGDSYVGSDFVNAEYTLFFQHSSGIQSQKVLVMDDGTTAYSQEYGIMSSNDLLVSVGATVKSGNVELWWTPETGVNGTITYRYTRETMI
jgi:hypothetical protein